MPLSYTKWRSFQTLYLNWHPVQFRLHLGISNYKLLNQNVYGKILRYPQFAQHRSRSNWRPGYTLFYSEDQRCLATFSSTQCGSTRLRWDLCYLKIVWLLKCFPQFSNCKSSHCFLWFQPTECHSKVVCKFIDKVARGIRPKLRVRRGWYRFLQAECWTFFILYKSAGQSSRTCHGF